MHGKFLRCPALAYTCKRDERSIMYLFNVYITFIIEVKLLHAR